MAKTPRFTPRVVASAEMFGRRDWNRKNSKRNERKIEKGEWVEGKQYRKAADGRIYIDLEGFSSGFQENSVKDQLTNAEVL